MTSADLEEKVAFQPVGVKLTAEWSVDVTLPSGQHVRLGRFVDEAAAREWIRLNSAEWLKLKQCEINRRIEETRGG